MSGVKSQSKSGVVKNDSADDVQWGCWDECLLVYLLLPVPVFFLGVFRFWLAVPAVLLLVGAYWHHRATNDKAFALSDLPAMPSLALIFCVAFVWSSLGGAGHTFYANEIDWIPRFSVLRDLVEYDWIPRYISSDDQEYLLRAPVGFYLLPALLGKVIGLQWADKVLQAWVCLGVVLVFLANFRYPFQKLLFAVIVFVWSSGLDILGFLWMSDGYLPNAGFHIEWWTNRMKYSSNSTMLYWIPNHVLPGWAIGGWLYRFRRSAFLIFRAPLIAIPTLLWSPLLLVGALPILILTMWRMKANLARHWRNAIGSAALSCGPLLLIAIYLTIGANKISGWGLSPPNGTGYFWWEVTLLFIVLEVLAFAYFAMKCGDVPLISVVVMVLCSLPFFAFGPTNDLLTLGGIPGLTIIWLTLIDEMVAAAPCHRLTPGHRAVLMGLFCVGAVTPFQETYRVLANDRWEPNLEMPAPVAMYGFPPHYYAQGSTIADTIFRSSKPVPVVPTARSK